MGSVQDVVDALAREPLRHIVLLKQLAAYPEHVKVHRVSGPEGNFTLSEKSPTGVANDGALSVAVIEGDIINAQRR
jgi:hypothetical protein